jgi:hypothetical protein
MMISTAEVGRVVATYRQGIVAPVASSDGRAAPAATAPGADPVDLAGTQIVTGLLDALHRLPEVRADAVQRAAARAASGVQPSGRDVARQMLARAVGDRLGAGS